MELMYSAEGFYIYKGTTSNKQVCRKLKENFHCSSWVAIRDQPYRVTSMDEPNFVHFFYHMDRNNLFRKCLQLNSCVYALMLFVNQ